jgi:hypothetical protein
MSTSSPTNPYETPRDPTPVAFAPGNFADRDSAELADLRRRVAELEKRLGRSWVVHPNFFLRAFSVFGYFFVAYAMLAFVVGVVVGGASLLLHFIFGWEP